MKYLSVVIIAVITGGLLIISCSKESLDQEAIGKESQTIGSNLNSNYLIVDREFDYSFYNSHKDDDFDLPIFHDSNATTADKLDSINAQYGPPNVLGSYAYQYFDYTPSEVLSHAVNDGVFNTLDVQLLDSFQTDCLESGFIIAINNFENSVSTLSLSDSEFSKYEDFANVVSVFAYQLNGYQDPFQVPMLTMSWGCANAIAYYCLATVSVGVLCSPPLPVGCYLGIAGAVISYSNMLESC